jgi:signal transduction histidine kinase
VIASARGTPFRLVLVGALLVVEGAVSVRIGYPSFDFRNAVVVFLTGLIVGGAGLVTWHRASWSRTGPLIAMAAAAWYVGGFRWVAFGPAAQLADALDLVFAAVLAHAVLTYPTGRVSRAHLGLAITAGYLAAVMPVPRADALVALVLLLALAVTWLGEPRTRRQRRPALLGGLLFAFALAGYRLVPSLIGGLAWLDTRPLLQLGLVVVAITLARPLIRAAERSQRVTDVVVELATDPGSDLTRTLGELVGDPAARIGFWDARQRRYLDNEGRPLELARAGDLVATVIEGAGAVMAVVEHRSEIAIDARIRAAIATAVELAAANARLQAEVRDQLVEVRASRRRLLLAADEERLRLEEDLFASLDPQFDELEATLSGARSRHDDTIGTTLELVRQTRSDIVSLIRGWGPPALDGRGVAGALEDVVAQASLRVDLEVGDIGQPSRAVQSALVFVASEALANAAKHAGATTVSVRLTRSDDTAHLDVADDGRGGADPAAGTGLLGLRDRVEAMGGRLAITSLPGEGTQLRASVPLTGAGS